MRELKEVLQMEVLQMAVEELRLTRPYFAWGRKKRILKKSEKEPKKGEASAIPDLVVDSVP